MTEAQFIAWFTSHPFTHALVLATYGAVAAEVRADRESFSKAKVADANAIFDWKVAFRHYALGGGIAAGTVLTAEILHILNSSGGAVAVMLLGFAALILKPNVGWKETA